MYSAPEHGPYVARLVDVIPLTRRQAFNAEGKRVVYSVQLSLMEQGNSIADSQRIIIEAIPELRDTIQDIYIETIDVGDFNND